MTKILVINGSYRDDGVTDQVVEAMVSSLREESAEIEVITLILVPLQHFLSGL